MTEEETPSAVPAKNPNRSTVSAATAERVQGSYLFPYWPIFRGLPLTKCRGNGYTTTVTHCIPTGEAHPVKQRHRRIPPHVFQEVKQHIQDLVARGVLKERCSPWASPAVVVMKKEGSVRFCCDNGKLNRHAYPLPTVEESLCV